jgi:Fe-S cluster assembly iron-binding protein IscA
MLQVTDRAASVFQDILAADDVEGQAIRLKPGEAGAGGFDIVAITDPKEDDVPTEARGVDVFVAPELAEELDRLILDANITDSGPAFFVRPQTG